MTSSLYRYLLRRILLGLLFAGGAQVASAAPGDIDTTFNSKVNSSAVQSAVILPDRTMFIAGGFDYDFQVPQKGLAKIRADGSYDLSFSPRFTIRVGYGGAGVNHIALDRQNRLVIAGPFSHVNGVTRRGIARIDQAGAVDHSFDPVLDDDISCLQIQPDGKILVGGEFTSVGGLRRPYLARLNEDGSVDANFAPLSGDGLPVNTIQLLANGKIIAGGINFTTSSGIQRKGLIRLMPNGDLDAAFNPPLSAGKTEALAIHEDGKIVAGGSFTATLPSVITSALRFNTNGSIDNGFLPVVQMDGYEAGAYEVQSLAVQSDGKVLIGGGFNKINGSNRSYLARLHYNGTLDTSFASNASHWVSMIAQDSTGDFLVSQSMALWVEPRTAFFRLANPSTDSLTFPTSSSIRWTRGADSAAIQGVAFSLHANGVSQPLGHGTLTSNGWELSGVTLPAEGVVRAKPISLAQAHLASFATRGTPYASYQITDTQNQAVGDNQTINFGNTWEGTAKELRFSIRNTGSAMLAPTLPLITGTNSADFEIAGFQGIPLAPGESQEFAVRFKPSAGSTRVATLQLPFNQPGLSSISLPLTGTTGAALDPILGGLQPVATAHTFSATGKLLGTPSLNFAPPSHTVITLLDNRLTQNSPSSLPNPAFPIEGTFADLQDKSLIHLDFGGHSYPFLVNYAGGDGNDLTLSLVGEGTVDPTFRVQLEPYSDENPLWVRSAFLPDGRFYVTGTVHKIDGQNYQGIARINPNGTVDPSFRFLGRVSAKTMVLQKDGKILLAGTFDYGLPQAWIGLMRINPDGKIDRILASSTTGVINSVIVRPDQKILVLGKYAAPGESEQRSAILMNPNGGVDNTFRPKIEGTANGGTLQPDGKLLLRGTFNKVQDTTSIQLARLNADGSLDEAFNPVFKAQGQNNPPFLYASFVQPDGKMVIAGKFVEINGVFRNNIVRLNADGSVDQAFVAQADFEVADLYPLQNGMMFASGYFVTAGGQPARYIAKYFVDGTIDPSFRSTDAPIKGLSGITRTGQLLLRDGRRMMGIPTTSTLENPSANDVVWHRADHLGAISAPRFEVRAAGASAWENAGSAVKIAGGWKVSSAGLPAVGAIRVTGHGEGSDGPQAADEAYLSLGTEPAALRIKDPSGTSISPVGLADFGSTIPIDPKTLALTIENTSSATITNLNALISGANASDFQVESGTIGDIPPYGSQVVRIRFNATTPGVKEATMALEITPGVPIAQTTLRGEIGTVFSPTITSYSEIRTVPTDFNASLYHLGTIDLRVPPMKDFPITLLKSTGASLGAFQNAPNGSTVTARHQGEIYRFTITYTSSGSTKSAILNFLPHGSGDPSFNAMLNVASGGSLAVQPDGKNLFSGSFTQAGGRLHERMARLNRDGTVDHEFNCNVNSLVECIVVQRDGKIMIAGPFSTVNGVNRKGLARLHPDGTLDESFNANLTGSASRLVMTSGGYFIGGSFSKVGEIPRNGLALLLSDGQLDESFEASLGTSTIIYSLLVQPDGKLLAGGVFNLPSGTVSYFSRFLPNGSLDTFFPAVANNTVSAIASGGDGKLLIGGHFTSISGESRERIARLNADGTVDQTFSAANGANGAIACIAPQANGRILICGQFSRIGGQIRTAIARLTPDGSLDYGFLPAGSSTFVRSIALTGDGSIMANGDFSNYGALSRNALIKLLAEEGGENLMVQPEGLRWNRHGAIAAVDSVTFSFSNDGESWTALGNGTADESGWYLAGAAPPPGFVRAEGRTSASNRSGGLARTTLLSGRSQTALETWRENRFGTALPEGGGTDSADPDHDGLTNLLEFAFGLSPTDSVSRDLPSWTFNESDCQISFEKPANVAGISYVAEWSTTLASDDWHPIENLGTGDQMNFSVPTGEYSKIFLRLKVAEN